MAGLADKILAVHEMLESLGVAHQFGGAIALAWYRSPRATTDIDLNITVDPDHAAPVLGALAVLGVRVRQTDRRTIRRDGQARLDWQGSYLDVFFASLDFHLAMAAAARTVSFGPTEIPILSPEHLIVCKAIFDRAKDWVDIEAMVAWGTEVDAGEVFRWVDDIMGPGSAPRDRLARLLPPPRASRGRKAAR